MVKVTCSRIKPVSIVGILVQSLAIGLLATGPGCAAGGAEKRSDALVAESDERTDDDILFAAIVDVFDEEGIDSRVVSEDRRVVLSTWERVNREVRHRWVARVVRVKAGLVLKVRSQYERRDLSGDVPNWVAPDDDYTLEQAHREEQQMGAAIQSRFRALGGGR